MTYTREQVEKILRDNGVNPDVLDPRRVNCHASPADHIILHGRDGNETRDLCTVDDGRHSTISLDASRARKLIAMLKAGFNL